MSISMFCGFDEMLEGIKETYDSVCSDNQRLRETLDNWNRDAEIQKAEKLAEHYRRHSLHHLSDREMKAIEEFRNQHYASCNNGSRYIFELTGTGIGEAISIQCPVCGEQKDVTDVEDW